MKFLATTIICSMSTLNYQMCRHLRRKFPNCSVISERRILPLQLNVIETSLRKLGRFYFFTESTFHNLTLQNQHIRPADDMSGHLVETFIPRALLCQFNFRARSAQKKIPYTFFLPLQQTSRWLRINLYLIRSYKSWTAMRI